MTGLTDAANVSAAQPPVVTTWTTSTPQNTSLVFNTVGMDTIAVTINLSGTISAGAVTFNVFDGASFIPVKCPRISSYNTDSTYNLVGASGIQGWTVPIAGYPQFQIILNTALTGAGATALVTVIVSSSPDVSVVTAGIDPNSTLPTHAANSANPTASNGLTAFRTNAVTTIAVGAVKATGGKIHRITIASSAANLSANNNYLKLYNNAAPTVGTTTPVYTMVIPPAGLNFVDLFGLSFSTAISMAVTGAYTDADTTAPTGYTAQIDYV
jgi:hypothetical protein